MYKINSFIGLIRCFIFDQKFYLRLKISKANFCVWYKFIICFFGNIFYIYINKKLVLKAQNRQLLIFVCREKKNINIFIVGVLYLQPEVPS